jgi:hypothetical protein
VAPAQRAPEGEHASGGDRPRQIERHPAIPRFHVGPPAPIGSAMEVQERNPAHVEDPARLLDDARPLAKLGEETGKVVEQLGRTVRHRRYSTV